MDESRHRGAPVLEPADRTLALQACHLSKSFAASRALRDVNLDVAAGEVRALLGGNGSGKSTLIKILSGYHRPDPGSEVLIGGHPTEPGNPSAAHRAGARFVHQDLGLIAEASVADNIALGTGFPTTGGTIRRSELRRRAAQALARVEVDLDPRAKVASLSAAQRTGVAVARAMATDDGLKPRLLVLDEPTATLPLTQVDDLLAVVRSAAAQGVGIIYVTHRIDEIFGLARLATVLRNGEEVATVSVDEVDRAGIVDLLVGSELREVSRESRETAAASGPPVLSVSGLCTPLLQDVDLDVGRGEVVGVSGLLGSGREELSAAVFGVVERIGAVRVEGVEVPALEPADAVTRGLAFVPADRKVLGGFMGMSARENLISARVKDFWRAGRMRLRDETRTTRTWWTELDIKPADGGELPLGSLSGGNQQKVILAKWLRLRPRVLLLDEPTQGVDLGARAQIHHQILAAAADGTAVVVTSVDIDELVALCHRVVVVRDGHVVDSLEGDRLTVAQVSRSTLSASDAGSPLDPHVSREGV